METPATEKSENLPCCRPLRFSAPDERANPNIEDPVDSGWEAQSGGTDGTKAGEYMHEQAHQCP